MNEYPYGNAYPSLDSSVLHSPQAQALLRACNRHADFTVRELRDLSFGAMVADGIVVECDNRQVPARNPVGIRPIEPLLLIIWRDGPLYDVRALRRDFPILVHQNGVDEGEPVSLCLYEQSPDAIARSWTPERYLARVLWWLGQSSLGALHASDQPLEGLFYNGSIALVLPHDLGAWLDEKRPVGFVRTEADAKGTVTLRLVEWSKINRSPVPTLLIDLPPVTHQPLSRSPRTLGELADYFQLSGGDFLALLRQSLATHYPSGQHVGEPATDGETFLLLRVPRVRTSEADVERMDILGIRIIIATIQLALDVGILMRSPTDGKIYVDVSIGQASLDQQADTGEPVWRKHAVALMHPRFTATPADARRSSGIADAGASFRGLLAGAGALGSALLNTWVRGGWGEWTVVDDDSLMPHNLTRHISFDMHIGHNKASVCADLANLIYDHVKPVVAFPGKINSPAAFSALNDSDLVVDATTSLAAARDLSRSAHKGRTISVFLTPSGRGSVVLMEDTPRLTRLFNLESQYYRALLRASWGEHHLATSGRLRTGHGCRDVSFVLSNESVQLHAALLARQLRSDSVLSAARIRVYGENDEGGVDAIDVAVADARSTTLGSWTIGWDTQLEEEWFAEREAQLPSETGGILLGVTDTASKTIQVVDFQRASSDSKGTSAWFLRGTCGVADALQEAQARTGQQVDYVGDWHTHPDGAAVRPSLDDVEQLAGLTARLSAAGLPALQAIVGRSSASSQPAVAWSLGHLADDGDV